jgi:hypothetical protein
VWAARGAAKAATAAINAILDCLVMIGSGVWRAECALYQDVERETVKSTTTDASNRYACPGW